MLGWRYGSAIFWNNSENWGLKNLIKKALHNHRQPKFRPIFNISLNGILPDDWQILFTSAKTVQSPLILDLDGDGMETTTGDGGAYFDHDKNGFAEQTGWASSDDGLLVRDRNRDGIINDGKELFGNNTLLKNNTLASNGFQALAEWDDNKNGKIDINDSVWSNLKVWQDYDGDGYSSSDELLEPLRGGHCLDQYGLHHFEFC